MFSNLREGATLYVLNKKEPKLDIGEVAFVSPPTLDYGSTYTAGYSMMPKMVVDVKVRVGGDVINLQKLPSDMSIADFGNGMFVCEMRENVINEIENMRKTSQRVIDSVKEHEHIVARCEELMLEINPEAKQDAERTQEINQLRDELAEIKSLLLRKSDKKKED